MSELSEDQYRNRTRLLIDGGTLDPDEIFRGLVVYHLAHDKEDDWFWDTQDDMEEIFDAMADILAENFRGQPPGSDQETPDARRFRRVRNWVESVEYDDNNILQRAATPTNVTGKFDNRMDAVMHFIAGAAVAANLGETLADQVSVAVEVADQGKAWMKALIGRTGEGFDVVDLQWGVFGSELQNAFDVSDSDARKLAKKFVTGQFTLSRWYEWYGKSDSVLY